MRHRATLHFDDGTVISSWVKYSLRDTYTDPLAALSFVTRPPRDLIAVYRERTAKGTLCNFRIDNVNQGSFLVDTQTIGIGRDGVTISLDCRAPVNTPYQGGVNPDLSFSRTTDSPIETIVLEALAPYGFDQLIVDAPKNIAELSGKAAAKRGAVIPAADFKSQAASAQAGESAYAFAARLFSRFGVCLRSAADGTILLGAPDYEQEASYVVGQTFGGQLPTDSDRFLDGVTVKDTNDDQFSECIVRGERGDKKGVSGAGRPVARVTTAESEALRPPGAPSLKVPPTLVPSGRHSFTAGAATSYKPLYIDDRHARDADRCASVAKLALGMRAKNAFVVTGVVDGHVSRTGRVWTVDTIARVIVEAADLDEDLWLSSRTLAGDASGQTTQLEFIPKHALILGDPGKS